jgi:hypothetical protein
MSKADTVSWLELPEREFGPYLGNSLLHGADKVAGSYAGLRVSPTKIKGAWIHGWYPRFLCSLDSDLPFGELVRAGDTRYVATKFHEEFLSAHGLPTKAIGLPIAYLPPRAYRRRAGTLLVMPVHSETSTTHKWKFREYAQQISELKPHFDEIVACVHTSCITNGYWVNEFREIGVPVIEGAHGCDRNSLERIRALMSQFEFMTTNGFGSNIAYASAFGAKASIHGEFCNYTEADHPDLYFFSAKPGLLEELIRRVSEESIRSHLAEFFTDPLKAQQRVEWGLEQIGYRNRISPAEMRRCFGWKWYQGHLEKVRKKSNLYFHIASNRLLTRRMREVLEEWKEPALKVRNTELRRLKSLPSDQAGTAILDGHSFHFLRPADFLEEYRRIFEDDACAFLSTKASPVIVDWGAGIGIAARFWARKYPKPVIHAYTETREERELLLRNTEEVGNATVSVYESVDKLSGLFEAEIDFLRIELAESSIDALLNAKEGLKAVKRCLVVCKTAVGQKQKLSRVLDLLEQSGFRYHLRDRKSSPNPLVFLAAEGKVDCQIEVWAYQGEKFPNTISESIP